MSMNIFQLIMTNNLKNNTNIDNFIIDFGENMLKYKIRTDCARRKSSEGNC